MSAYHDHYQEYYQDEDPEWRLLCAQEKVQNIVSLCGSIKHARVLEIGAGDGAITQLLCDAQFSTSHHAIEISSSGVEALKNRALPAHVEIDLFDGVTVPFEDDRFDVVILSHVVEHLLLCPQKNAPSSSTRGMRLRSLPTTRRSYVNEVRAPSPSLSR